MPATAEQRATRKARSNKINRVVVPFLYDNPGATINDMIDPKNGKPVEALYVYAAARTEDAEGNPLKPLIEKLPEPVRTGKRGRPANRWKLTKAAKDAERKRRARAEKAAAATEVPVEVPAEVPAQDAQAA